MLSQNPILDSSNTPTTATVGTDTGATSLSSPPLGVGPDGELGLKIVVINPGDIGGPGSVTPHIFALGASVSKTIPSGSKGWSVVFTSGTGTIGGVAVPANFGGDSDTATLAVDLIVTTDADSSAYIRYNS